MVQEFEDPEMKHMAQEEEKQLTARKEIVDTGVKASFDSQDPNDDKNIILEIRGGTGGDKATLLPRTFSVCIPVMPNRKAGKSSNGKLPSSLGGLKDVVAAIQGDKVYSKLKYESGVHRVQRVPATETQGRIHTSAATVAVLPEADEIDIKIEAKDLRIDTFCSSGPGGQSVDTTYSAVRISPSSQRPRRLQQDEKSQIKNRAKAMHVLRARLYEMEMESSRPRSEPSAADK